MSQVSHLSEGAFSDILPDVDKFIEENGIKDDVGQLLHENTFKPNDEEEDEDYKPHIQECLGDANNPSPSNHPDLLYPPDQPTDLCNDDYPGPFSFEVYIIPNEQKTPWEYSLKLNKIFIAANLKFPVAFSIKPRPNEINLYVRATPVYSQAQHFQEVVMRCIAHQHPQDPSNRDLPTHIFRHIMRCTNEETLYCGSQDERARPNILLPLSLPQTGSEVVKEFFYFVCQNSCPSGMNRRPIEVIFTLEDQSGQVLGRRVLSARVCKCPKRDKEKDEAALEKSNQQPSQGKRRKLNHPEEAVDTKLYSLKDIYVVGKDNYLHLLKTARGLMAGQIIKSDNKSDSPFRKCHTAMDSLINKISGE